MKNGTSLLLAAGLLGSLASRYAVRKSRETSFNGASVIISGGSRGLGLEMARRFAGEGAKLTLLARDGQNLERVRREFAAKGTDIATIVCDVRTPGDVEAAVRDVIQRRGRVDVLVNNAGIIQAGPVEHMSRQDFKDALDTHLWGALYLTREVIPHMRKQGSGRIVNITSIGGLVAVPHLLPYATSKFALVGFSDGMRAELAKYGIRVTTVAPGLMRTGSHVNAFFKGQHETEFALFSLSNAMPAFSTSSAHAARKIVRACRYGDAHLTLTAAARLMHVSDTLFPNATAALMKTIDAILPGPASDATGDVKKSGWDSQSALAPSWLTRLSDKMISRNKEGKQ